LPPAAVRFAVQAHDQLGAGLYKGPPDGRPGLFTRGAGWQDAGMNVFVLCTGRCGSTTFARACQHMTNYSVGHESRVGKVGEDRLDFPPNHIEADHHLAFYLGRVDEKFGDEACYVHLTRDLALTADSWAERFRISPMMSSYRRGMIGSEAVSRHDAALEMVETATANIRHFLKDKSRVARVRLEHAEEDFPAFWKLAGAEGSLHDALAEWRVRHNEGTWRPPFLTGLRDAARFALRAAIPPR
jgi:hypothetical protein